MALKFLNKKGWHTGSLRNIENVWKAEQKHEAEQKKLEELKKQIQDEREQHEFRQLQEQAGLVPKQERLEFLYDSGLAVGKGNSEGFTTLGKPGESQQKSETQSDIDKLSSAPGALFVEEKPQSANDTWRKLHSDPLLMIRQREQAALAQIKNNPVKMEMIKKSMEEKRQRKDEKARRKAEKKKRHKEKKRRRSPSTDTDTCDEKRKRKCMKHATSCDSDSDGSAGNSCDENKKNSRDCYIEPKLEKCYDRTKSDNLKVQGLNSDMGHNRADFKYGKKAIEKHRDWRYDDIPTGARIPQPSFRERQRSPSHHRERQILPSHHRERHRTTLHDRERSRSPSDFGERHREKYSLDHSHSYPRSRYLDSNERDGDRNGLHRQSAVNGSRNARDECSDGPLVPEKSVAGPDISSKPAPRGKYQAGKLSEEEKAARLREMQIDAELHDEQRWQRLKKASDADALEAKQSNANSGKNFLDATNRSVYGAEKGGSSTIEESVRRRTHYLQSSASARDGNAFRR